MQLLDSMQYDVRAESTFLSTRQYSIDTETHNTVGHVTVSLAGLSFFERFTNSTLLY